MLDAIRTRLDERANQNVGLLAEFSDPGALYDAVKGMREKGYSRLDTFSPFPIHGMDRAMGLGVSKLGFIVFGLALVGLFLGWFLQWWTSAGPQFDWWPGAITNLAPYPINISNKPLFSWEASVPVMFELTILFSALGAVGGMLALNGLPKPYNLLFHSERFGRATDDAFFLHISKADGQFGRDATTDDLFDLGALAVEYVDHDGATDARALPTSEGNGAASALPEVAPATPSRSTGAL